MSNREPMPRRALPAALPPAPPALSKGSPTRAPRFRRLPALLLAAALIGMAASFVHNARPADAQTTIWSATLTAQSIIGLFTGCQEGETPDYSCALTDDTFTYNGVSYQVIRIFIGTTISYSNSL